MMNCLLTQGILIWIFLSLTESTRHSGYHYPPPSPASAAPAAPTAVGGFPGPGTAGGTGPGPLSGPGPTGAVGPSAFGPGPIGPSAAGPLGPGLLGPGPLGPGPYLGLPGPFGFGPFAPHSLPFAPPHAHGPCHLLKLITKHLPNLFQPILVSGIGFVLLWIVRHIVFPYLGLFAHRMGRALEDADQATIDRLSNTVKQAISKGVCLERLACQIGRRSKNYHISPSIFNMIKLQHPNSDSLIDIFRLSASGEITSCDVYTCWDKQSTVNSPYNQNSTSS